jgi:hypothetical protein
MRREIQNPQMFETDPESFYPSMYLKKAGAAVQNCRAIEKTTRSNFRALFWSSKPIMRYQATLILRYFALLSLLNLTSCDARHSKREKNPNRYQKEKNYSEDI